ncbi:hypothetical protein CL3_29360 [butyrate-producing bacterium SM4/1]|nr:hypothetical protein CL3_29360 [butyrate-producing bacterium SM4/1]
MFFATERNEKRKKAQAGCGFIL